jgi:outer membrane receptor protein involved in Fe transport
MDTTAIAGAVRAAVTIGALLASPAGAAGQPAARSPQDLKRLTIEELTQIEVSSVSRRAERLSQAAAAVDIVRGDDIRRSGATTLAEAMRLADGLDVARADAHTWAISTRGFTITTANKLLVMIDGRTVYSPLFAGTLWDVQDTFVADIDRVEIVRGPGGSIWGANAVNGVVNIIMKDAASTRGAAGFLGVGSDERLIGSSRYGGRLAAGGSYREVPAPQRQSAVVGSRGRRRDRLRPGRVPRRVAARRRQCLVRAGGRVSRLGRAVLRRGRQGRRREPPRPVDAPGRHGRAVPGPGVLRRHQPYGAGPVR